MGVILINNTCQQCPHI